MRSDGSSPRLLIEDAADPAFSPDGRRLAYISARDANGSLTYGDRRRAANELYVAAADGRSPRRLTRTRDLNEARPTWSPGGTRIAFQRGEVIDNAEATAIRQVNADGTCEQSVLAHPRLNTWYASPAWRPTASRPRRLSC
jgi:TolB protein